MAFDVSIMLEGQYGLTWERWKRIAQAAEDLGFAGLYRSDHFVIGEGEYQDALETWASLAWLAGNTKRIEFGPMVSPVSFRNPSILAWQATAIAIQAEGRLRLGLGAGWNEREHKAFGFDLGDIATRFDRLEEATQVITGLTRSTVPFSFAGRYFTVEDALLKPIAESLPLVIGGNGPKRTLPLAARYMDEWNALMVSIEDYRALSSRLDELIGEAGRKPGDVRRTLMTRTIVGRSDAEVEAKAGTGEGSRRGLVGTPNEIVERLGQFAEAGLQGILMQHLDLDDIDTLELIATDVIPQLS